MPASFENPGPSRAEVSIRLADYETQEEQINGIAEWIEEEYSNVEIRGIPLRDLIIGDLPSYAGFIQDG